MPPSIVVALLLLPAGVVAGNHRDGGRLALCGFALAVWLYAGS